MSSAGKGITYMSGGRPRCLHRPMGKTRPNTKTPGLTGEWTELTPCLENPRSQPLHTLKGLLKKIYRSSRRCKKRYIAVGSIAENWDIAVRLVLPKISRGERIRRHGRGDGCVFRSFFVLALIITERNEPVLTDKVVRGRKTRKQHQEGP